MRIIYNKTQSTIKPELIDTNSSESVVYLRKNILEIVDNTQETPITMFEYDEAILTKEEYQEYLAEMPIRDIQQQRADIDYIALMSGINLEENV